MKYQNLKRWIERTMFGGLIKDVGIELMEEKVPGFWHMVSEFFTA